MSDFKQEVEPKAGKEDIGHPAGKHGRQRSSTAQRNRDGMSRPVAESNDERLPDPHGHASSAYPAPP